MNRKRVRFAPSFTAVHAALESRIALSGAASAMAHVAGAAHQAPTHTTLAVSTSTLGTPLTVNVSVSATASAGAPQGTVNILDRGRVIQSLTLRAGTAADAGSATSTATATLYPTPGGAAYFFGKHSLTAQFVPSGPFRKSTGHATLIVNQPTYTTLADGVKVATIAPGSGPAIQSAQTANMLYTGYLAKNGKIFDDSQLHNSAPFSFKLGSGQVIPGFDAGVLGMKAGETRIVLIPPAEGYGPKANGPIPGNSTLLFVLTLKSIG